MAAIENNPHPRHTARLFPGPHSLRRVDWRWRHAPGALAREAPLPMTHPRGSPGAPPPRPPARGGPAPAPAGRVRPGGAPGRGLRAAGLAPARAVLGLVLVRGVGPDHPEPARGLPAVRGHPHGGGREVRAVARNRVVLRPVLL